VEEKMNRVLRLSVLLIAGSLAAACAFGERQAHLGYPPEPDAALVSSAEAALASRGIVYIGNFGDVRSSKMIVGHVRNGFGMKTAEVVAQRDVPGWVREALAHELKASGYQVMDGVAPEDGATISGDIIRVYCDAYFTYDGEVTLRMETGRAGQSLVKNVYTGTGSAGLNWGATGDSYSESLSMALQSALRKFIADLGQHEI
jgi:uncharacterized lipoprotein YajG